MPMTNFTPAQLDRIDRYIFTLTHPGECWHEVRGVPRGYDMLECSCIHCDTRLRWWAHSGPHFNPSPTRSTDEAIAAATKYFGCWHLDHSITSEGVVTFRFRSGPYYGPTRTLSSDMRLVICDAIIQWAARPESTTSVILGATLAEVAGGESK